MSNSDLTAVLFLLLLLVALAQLLGYLFVRMRQPKVIGEILAGIVLGPAVLGRLQIGSSSLPELSKHHAPILNFDESALEKADRPHRRPVFRDPAIADGAVSHNGGCGTVPWTCGSVKF
jgi:NhaP-type Na+/H+ or K+/H+ antiporter